MYNHDGHRTQADYESSPACVRSQHGFDISRALPTCNAWFSDSCYQVSWTVLLSTSIAELVDVAEDVQVEVGEGAVANDTLLNVIVLASS
jgi:hypothetical protein